ncbi:hypothetical protein [Rhizobium leguminosarum]|uniref:hypothetical protein n=1 Tax=Rhizobium leguminosarum TaxID=384 RepID=UPI003F9A9B39
MKRDEKIAHHELAHKAMAEAEDYIRRGRHLRGLPTDDLESEFVSSVQLVVRDGDDNASRLAMHDALAEFDLRGAEPPYHLVREETRVMAERGKARNDARSDEERQRIEHGIQARYADAEKKKQ